jgi:hypothetical protein
MINYYQPWVLPFLQFRPQRAVRGIKSRYYFSFEDALWDIFHRKFPRKKVKVLVPDFYCSNVLDNIRLHGHEYIYYQLDKNFQISPESFRRYLWLFRPDVVIIFHACGISSGLMADTSWLSDLPPHALIIEDGVHRLIDPSRIKLLNDRHFLIDSLRKVSPFPGSRVFASPRGLLFPPPDRLISAYAVSSFLLYLLFRKTLKIGFILNSSKIVFWAHEKILRAHDEIIGDSYIPHPGLSVFLPLINRINYQKVTNQKQKQVRLYEKYLHPLFSKKAFYRIRIPESDFGLLHVYPLGFTIPPSKSLINNLHSLGIPVWFKFTDTPWSVRRSVLFLPLGFHLDEKQIQQVTGAILSWSQLHPKPIFLSDIS